LTAAGVAVTLAAVDWLRTTLAMYGRSLARGGELAIRNWPMFAALFVFAGVINAAYFVAPFFGPLGGILLYLVTALCFGAFLGSVEPIVKTGVATFDDFRSCFGKYFGDVIGVMFALWIFQLVTSMLAASPNGLAIAAFSSLLVWVLFNAVPELIYLGHYSTLELLGESYRFITQNWIEWFPLNFVLAVGAMALWHLPSGGLLLLLLKSAATALFVYFTMVVRGLLFLELADTSRRGRIFRHRAGG